MNYDNNENRCCGPLTLTTENKTKQSWTVYECKKDNDDAFLDDDRALLALYLAKVDEVVEVKADVMNEGQRL